jgi:hypothetical protein
MYQCSECGLLIGAEDETVINEPSRPCTSCRMRKEKEASGHED